MAPKIDRSTRLMVIIGISFSFFVAEISIGFYTHSLALVADAFHYMNDLVGFIVALVALRISQRADTPKALSFGWQRAQLLGAFFNGVFLLALGMSIFLQSIERFISLQHVENPMLVMIMGCVGLTLNIISALFLHEHDHGPGISQQLPALVENKSDNVELNAVQSAGDHPHKDHRHKVDTSKAGHGHDLGMMGVLIHVIGDAINNIGVIIASAVIWKANYEGRFYADPGVSMGIAIMILLSSIPLVKNSGSILLESVPLGVTLEDIQHDLEKVDGVISVHELHAWRLSQTKALASAHVLTSSDSLADFMVQAKRINECLHEYGIHSITLQPELVTGPTPMLAGDSVRRRVVGNLDGKNDDGGVSGGCRLNCGSLCEELTCCAEKK